MRLIKNPNFEFIAHRGKAVKISLAVIAVGIISLILHGGPNYGIDFTGGAAITFEFEQPVSAENVRGALDAAGMESYEVTHFGDLNHVLVRLRLGDAFEQDYIGPIQEQFNRVFSDNPYTIQQNDMVGPKIGTELREKAMLAMLFAMIGIIIYISIRFEAESFLGVLATMIFGLLVLTVSSSRAVLASDLWVLLIVAVSIGVVGYICVKFDFKYAVGAITALLHDVVITVGIFSLLNQVMDLSVVAALLTIVGYSLNDTIVLFDRVREDYPKDRKRLSMDRIINKSINNVLSRTVITSLTTMLVILILLLFGGEVIRPFALAIFIGIIVGTYSSVFIASPVLIYWHNRFGAGADLARKATA